MNFFGKLKHLGARKIEVYDDFEIKFEIDVFLFGKSSNVEVWFSSYNLLGINEQEFIINSISFFRDSIKEKEALINNEIVSYINEEFSDAISSCFEIDIEIDSLIFSGKRNYCILGNCCLGFSTSYDDEHGLGVVLKNWSIYKIGLADICSSKHN